MYRRMRCAKIVATFGPSRSTPVKLRDLFLAGADVFRLNFSHGTQSEHRSHCSIELTPGQRFRLDLDWPSIAPQPSCTKKESIISKARARRWIAMAWLPT
jgi:pyruvate kinase